LAIARTEEYLHDDEFRALQEWLMLHPGAGDPIQTHSS
jgi:hypothetical protein